MRIYIYKTDRPEYKFGYLELKPYTNPSMGKRHSAATKIIEQSRVPVSEELKKSGGFRFVMKEDAHLPLEYIEGRDFTLSGGVAVPVKEESKEKLKNRSEIMTILEKYSKFLEENGYTDMDWRTEEPYAIDEFMKTL